MLVSVIAATAGAVGLAIAARRRSTGLIVASLVALLVGLGESAFDASELMRDDDRSVGGISMLAAAAGLLPRSIRPARDPPSDTEGGSVSSRVRRP